GVEESRDLLVVRRDEARRPALDRLVERAHDRERRPRVLVAGRLVREEQPRAQRERTGEGGPLLLADRGLEGGAAPEPVEREEREERVDPRPRLLQPACEPCGVLDVL